MTGPGEGGGGGGGVPAAYKSKIIKDKIWWGSKES